MTQYPQATEVTASPVLTILPGTTQLADVELLVGRGDRNFSHGIRVHLQRGNLKIRRLAGPVGG